MAITSKPAHPVPKDYVPPGTLPHRVRDGESWVTLAVHHRMDPWELIRLNFRTDDPREVNWYLREYVGCRTETADRHNYRFSSADEPGIVHLPAPVPQRITMPPLTIGPDPNKKRVLVGLIEKETLFNVDSFGQPGSVRWVGSKRIIHEKFDWVPKDHVEHGLLKSPALYYYATGFSKTTISRYAVQWGPKDSTAMHVLRGAGKVGWFLLKLRTNQLESPSGANTYGSWGDYPRNPNDPMNRFRP